MSPVYEYECGGCGFRLEMRRSADETVFAACPKCLELALKVPSMMTFIMS